MAYAHGDRQDDQAVHHTSLTAASDVVQDVVRHLDNLTKQTFAAAGRHPVSDAAEPSAGFDAEYMDLLSAMPQAYASLIERLHGVADGIIEHSGNHKRAEQANERAIEDV